MTEIKIKKISKPITAGLSRCSDLFDVPPAWVRKQAAAGKIRSVKLGEARSASRVYYVEDIMELLEVSK